MSSGHGNYLLLMAARRLNGLAKEKHQSGSLEEAEGNLQKKHAPEVRNASPGLRTTLVAENCTLQPSKSAAGR